MLRAEGWRELCPLLLSAGFQGVEVSPRFVYVDASRPAWVEGFARNTYIAMVEGVREQALAAGLIARPDWDKQASTLTFDTLLQGCQGRRGQSSG
jgi:hypothetical protein